MHAGDEEMTAPDYLLLAQQHALKVAPDPGPELRWDASADGSLDVDLLRGHTIVGWITLTSRGWQPRWAWAEYRRPRSHDPRVAMQELLDALKEEMVEELPPAEEAEG
jgi:hypothetical protein